ncbi:hypothetical protein ANANG_G00153800 [Anguilla anguilla]|uniref:PH domain-containing protein n=1 Tax=Anguilla anguilla TaxID=7936 RepID=A0A9D3MA60_ANGAN|nr:hypothetical protein ANANG_G00153800 [Anguilla anguilla]
MAEKDESQPVQKLEQTRSDSMSSEYDDSDNKNRTRNRSRPSISDSISLFSSGSLSSYEADLNPHTSPVIKMGWLEKTPPRGSRGFQKRWVRLDADYLRYFKNEKENFSKKIIPISSIDDVVRAGNRKMEVVTQHRTFLFRAQCESERDMWATALEETMWVQRSSWSIPHSILMQGHLEMQGRKLYVVVCIGKVFLYENAEVS